MRRLLVISRDPDHQEDLERAFPTWEVAGCPDLQLCEGSDTDPHHHGVVIDLRLITDEREELSADVCRRSLGRVRKLFPKALIIAMAPVDRMRDLVTSMRAGATEYLTHPLREEELTHVRECLERTVHAPEVPDHLVGDFWSEDVRYIVGVKSQAMQRVFRKIRQVAETRSTVLLTGETGTGKSMLARLIHQHSNRRDRPYVAVHCGAIPDTLIESDLFGHEKGAFTGASRRKMGRFEVAEGGTLLLDEIGTVGMAVQIKLLEVLQDKSFHRVGGEKTIEVDVRIIAATNLDLAGACERGDFRKDLFYRLNVFPIEIPPLRERREDISAIVESFLQKFSSVHAKEVTGIDDDVLDAFQNYDWPGNIRELESVIERAFIMEDTLVLTQDSFEELMPRPIPVQPITSPPEQTRPIQIDDEAVPADDRGEQSDETLAVTRKRAADAAEEAYLRRKLAAHGGRIAETARSSGITVRQLHKLMTKHGLRKEQFKNKK